MSNVYGSVALEISNALKEMDTNEELSLFECACLGNPEKAIKGEVLHHLRNKGIIAVEEVGYKGGSSVSSGTKSPDLDLCIFSKNHALEDVIEFKHFTYNQPNIQEMFNNMKSDYDRTRPGKDQSTGEPVYNPKFIEVGLYTNIESIEPKDNLKAPGLYRIRTYYSNPKDGKEGDTYLRNGIDGLLKLTPKNGGFTVNPQSPYIFEIGKQHKIIRDARTFVGHVDFFIFEWTNTQSKKY